MSIHAAAALALLTLTGSAFGDTLQGRIVEDHSNTPLASVEVRVSRVGVRQLAADIETGPDGVFRGEDLPPGDYRIEASKPNYGTVTFHIPSVRSGILIRLVRYGVIAGQVVGPDGKPVRGAAVYAIPRPAGGGRLQPIVPGQGNYAQINERGQYRLHNLRPGDYVVAVSYGASISLFGSTGGGAPVPGLGSGVQLYPDNPRPQVFSVTGGEAYRADFTLLPNTVYSISGKVEAPAPADNANRTRYWLALTTEEQPLLATAVAETDASGSFRFEGIAPGSYRLTASGPMGGYGGKGMLTLKPVFGRTDVSVSGANVEGVSIPMQKGGALSFILRSEGGKLPEGVCPATAQMTLTATEDWATRIERTAELNFQKEQTVEQIAPARYQIDLARLGESCYQPTAPVLDLTKGLPESPVAVIVAQAGAIRGKLTQTSAPTSYAVALIPADATGDTQPLRVAFPKSDGSFEFDTLRPSLYRLSAQPAGETSRARWVSDRAHMIEIKIDAGAPTQLELPAPPANPDQ